MELRNVLGSERNRVRRIRPLYTVRWQADIAKIEALGFEPTWNLRQGLSDYAGWGTTFAEELMWQNH